ncbi:MAG: hypothetical protein ABIN97_13470 [Ginsengibacter sp.]
MMNTLSYIDAYFQHQLSDEERRIFEARCEQDTAFAGEVAYYVTSRRVLKEELLLQKQTLWTAGATDKPAIIINSKKNFILPDWLRYAVAACFILLAGFYFLNRTQSPQQIANNYVTKNLTHISQSMGNADDSLQLGIAAYNKKDYTSALQIFENLSQSHSEKSDAKKYAGYVYLVTQQYGKALKQFDALANIKGLYSNPGLFLKAIALIQRKGTGDTEQARIILNLVVKQGLQGKQEAEELLKKM